ncbi:unnamed protein product [Adineta steineri]|uniref:NAD(P)(+)--arginine ADP-ribosyltransferase n=2 Tax=Adineta steineri TaxID=433720 RepID=A0A814C338_9BILA|nr:unnamed protein product [Adineta steineri]
MYSKVDRTKLRPWFRYLKLFVTALAKLPVAPRQTVWRGVRKDHSAEYPPGDEVTWWAFSSCTTSLSVLESDLYLGNTGTRTLFSVETINGRTIRAHSHFVTEDEILLLPGTYFQVKSQISPAPDLHIVHLQQKIPPHVLLEPPFEGAELIPFSESDRLSRPRIKEPEELDDSRPWYTKKRILSVIAAVVALIILAIILGSVLGTQKKHTAQTTSTSTPTLTTTFSSIYYNGSAPDPVSVADAFYAFDGTTNDLYSLRNGAVAGGPVSYIQGYVPYGQAIVLNQSNTTQINIQPAFNLTTNSNFTIEGFFMLQKTQLNATLIQLAPNIMLNLVNGVLFASIGLNTSIVGTSVLSTQNWLHISFVYYATKQTATISIDGIVEATNSSVKLGISANNTNSVIIIGAGFQGYIDQLSISLIAKTQDVIQWDATIAAYYRLDFQWTLDSGPNGLNASGVDVNTIFGWRYDALNFNASDASFQANGFTALGTPQQAFSVALWVRAETRSGVFLTVANPYTCLLVLGLQNDGNKIVAYLPNATATGAGVNIVGPQMPINAWTHVAFTWSSTNFAKLYTSALLANVGVDATTLNNVRGGNNSAPMTVTLGNYSGSANCQGIQGVNVSQTFMGSLDEVFVFAREAQQGDLQQIIQTLPS